jgi:hypothetical protein
VWKFCVNIELIRLDSEAAASSASAAGVAVELDALGVLLAELASIMPCGCCFMIVVKPLDAELVMQWW